MLVVFDYILSVIPMDARYTGIAAVSVQNGRLVRMWIYYDTRLG